jgi:hypothetical protein
MKFNVEKSGWSLWNMRTLAEIQNLPRGSTNVPLDNRTFGVRYNRGTILSIPLDVRICRLRQGLSVEYYTCLKNHVHILAYATGWEVTCGYKCYQIYRPGIYEPEGASMYTVKHVATSRVWTFNGAGVRSIVLGGSALSPIVQARGCNREFLYIPGPVLSTSSKSAAHVPGRKHQELTREEIAYG